MQKTFQEKNDTLDENHVVANQMKAREQAVKASWIRATRDSEFFLKLAELEIWRMSRSCDIAVVPIIVPLGFQDRDASDP